MPRVERELAAILPAVASPGIAPPSAGERYPRWADTAIIAALNPRKRKQQLWRQCGGRPIAVESARSNYPELLGNSK